MPQSAQDYLVMRDYLVAYLAVTESKVHALIKISSVLNSAGHNFSAAQIDLFLAEVSACITRKRLAADRKARILECLARFKSRPAKSTE